MTQISSERIASIEARKHELASAMSAGNLAPEEFVRLSKDYAAIEPVADAAREVRRLRAELEVLDGLVADPTAEAELREMAQVEADDIRVRLPAAERALALKLLPRDSADERAAMLELRAGTGGDEAALFAGDLLRMYQRFAELQGWRFELISASASEVGGYKEAIASINGAGVFAKLKFESGVHRVQRVPVTESGGRIHTSARDRRGASRGRGRRRPDQRRRLAHRRLSLVRSGRAVGQHHRQRGADHPFADRPRGHPAGREEPAQEQGQGDEGAAHAPVRARARRGCTNERAGARKSMVGSGDRSERIRTYNFPQGRVTDHRINLTLHKLDEILEGGGLSEIVDALISEDEAERLAGLEEA